MKKLVLAMALLLGSPAGAETLLLKPAQVFDGADPKPHPGWQVLVEKDRITAVGPSLAAPADAKVIELPGETLMPGDDRGGTATCSSTPTMRRRGTIRCCTRRWRCAPPAR